MSAQLEIRDVSKSFGGVQAVTRAALEVPRGELLSVTPLPDTNCGAGGLGPPSAMMAAAIFILHPHSPP